MLTEEQIKNLKPGDSLIIHGKFIKEYGDCDDDIVIECKMTRGGFLACHNKTFHPSCVSLPSEIVNMQSKYDPCRKFKKGDKVCVVERNGRSPILCGAVELGYTYTVYEDEDDGDVILDIGYGVNGGEPISWTFLELVTPVEELEPYSVHETEYLFRVIRTVREGEQVVCEYRKIAHPNAKAAAEAERDKLNAEYRKKQQK